MLPPSPVPQMEDNDGEREEEGGSSDLKGSSDGKKNSRIAAAVG